MTSLGQKLKAHQDLKAIFETIVDDKIGETQAEELNALFAVFDKKFVLEKGDKGFYDLSQANHFFDICFERTKKAYSTKLMESMAIRQMFEE